MKKALPTRSYFRNTKTGMQLVVPAKHTIAKTIKRQQNEKIKSDTEKPEAKPESR